MQIAIYRTLQLYRMLDCILYNKTLRKKVPERFYFETILFVFYVHSTLEYGSVTWAENFSVHIDRIKGVQLSSFYHMKWKFPDSISDDHSLGLQYLGFPLLHRITYYYAMLFVLCLWFYVAC